MGILIQSIRGRQEIRPTHRFLHVFDTILVFYILCSVRPTSF